ncbi:MAG TPA: phenylacetate--CoA ligase family protein [Candidatus Binatia bacterium]|nr:phenylacetate--CoA ligase family protein [Candidatus Binatia bacterium]
MKPEQIKTVKDLSKLPGTTKNEIRHNMNETISTDYEMKNLRVLSTSGSTGQPLRVFISKEEDGFRKAKHLRANSSCGHKFSDRWLTVTSPSHFSEVKGVQKLLHFYSPEFVSVFWDVSKQLSAIGKFKPDVLDGYSSSLSLLAREVRKRGNSGINPRLIFGGAELIDDTSRRLLEETFKAPFYDQYATIEFERMAWQCPERFNYHIDADSIIMEFLDANGDEVSAGESGKIVCTSLFNYAMPFIRYTVGDSGVFSDEECTCGRTLPLLSRIEGRSDDLLLLPGGRAMSPRAITIAMGSFHLNRYIEQFKIVQRRRDKIEIQLKVEDLHADKRLIEKDLLTHFKSMLGIEGELMTFEIFFVDDIPLNKNGKLQIIDSKIDLAH